MAYLLVEDFRFGMDRRRKRVAGTPGTLWLGKNVHITRGGDVERRKKFIPEYSVPGTFGVGSLRSQLYVFGSDDLALFMPNGVQYQRLQAPSAPEMTGVLAVKAFSGKLYVIAEYADGNVYHFYDGTRVTDWDVTAGYVANFNTVADLFANKLDATELVKAVAFGSKLTMTAATAGVPFTVSKSTIDGGSSNNQDIILTTVQPNVVAVEEVLASTTITITGGTAEIGVNVVQSVQIDGVELLASPVNWTGSNTTTALNLSQSINLGFATHGYQAEAAAGVVTISAAPGTGAAANGLEVVAIAQGDVTLSFGAVLAGGVSAVAAQKQIVTAAFTGTFNVADTFTITLNDTAYTLTGRASGMGRSLYVSDSRVWSPVTSLLRYSMLNRADIWDSANPVTDNDSGIINIASESEGNENVQVVARYQGLAAIFSPDNITLFQLDPDPTKFARSQILDNTGTRSVDSVIRYGNNDVFYLDITGIRSLRARDSSNAPAITDIGSAIDTFVSDELAALTGAQVNMVVAAIEPLDGRYILFAGRKAFVLSNFPSAKISAWSYYDTEELDGDVQAAVRVRNRLVVRAGDYLYVYGGLDGDQYPEDDEIEGLIEMPFLSGKTPATIKHLKGIDCAATNTWELEVACDPNQPEATVNVGRLDRITFNDTNKISMPGETSMVAPRLRCITGGEASVSMFAIHYEADKAE